MAITKMAAVAGLALMMCGCASMPMSDTHPKLRIEYVRGAGWGELSCGAVVDRGVYVEAIRYSSGIRPAVSINFRAREDATQWLTQNWCLPEKASK